MKAVQVTKFGGPEVLAYVDLPDPGPAEGQVLIRAEAIGVNFADLKAREGGHISAAPPPPGGVKVTVQEVEPREIEILLDRRAQKTVPVRAVVQRVLSASVVVAGATAMWTSAAGGCLR